MRATRYSSHDRARKAFIPPVRARFPNAPSALPLYGCAAAACAQITVTARAAPADALHMQDSVPQQVALTGSRARTRPRRRVAHVMIGAASWAALGALWVWQLNVGVPSNWLAGIELIVVMLVSWTLFSLGWVAWNRNIYRRRHRRTRAVQRIVSFERDPLGRRILAPPGIGEARGQILVTIEAGTVKRYSLAPGSRSRRERARRPVPEPVPDTTSLRRTA